MPKRTRRSQRPRTHPKKSNILMTNARPPVKVTLPYDIGLTIPVGASQFVATNITIGTNPDYAYYADQYRFVRPLRYELEFLAIDPQVAQTVVCFNPQDPEESTITVSGLTIQDACTYACHIQAMPGSRNRSSQLKWPARWAYNSTSQLISSVKIGQIMAASTVANVFIGTAILRVEYRFWGYQSASITIPYNLSDYHAFMEYYIPKFVAQQKSRKEDDKDSLCFDKVFSDCPIIKGEIPSDKKHQLFSERRLAKNPKYD